MCSSSRTTHARTCRWKHSLLEMTRLRYLFGLWANPAILNAGVRPKHAPLGAHVARSASRKGASKIFEITMWLLVTNLSRAQRTKLLKRVRPRLYPYAARALSPAKQCSSRNDLLSAVGSEVVVLVGASAPWWTM